MKPYGSYRIKNPGQPVANTHHLMKLGLHMKGIKARARRLARLLCRQTTDEGGQHAGKSL